ncbi:AfsR/SARP family transcriptional regulator [Nocardia sp. NPDC020380]|uniref:AfsR/SARP family transcriptional regulator n=1 Tax=Nocardia sp. NPDC020380 TaxID=3364309 RepID=UPI0037B63559
MTDPGVRITVLGSMTLWQAGAQTTIGRPRTQAVLAALALTDGRPLSAAELVDAVWGEELPRQATHSLRTHVLLLRKLLEPDRGMRTRPAVLLSVGDGYRLRLEPDAIDVQRARRLATAAENAAAAHDPEQALALLTQALELWRGAPLIGVPGPFAESQRRALTELRITLLEARFEHALELHRPETLVAELTALTAEYPLRERLRGFLMTALDRSGRRGEALAVYQEARRTLIDELGIEPGRPLTELHQRILTDDLPGPAHSNPSARQPLAASTRPPGPNQSARQSSMVPSGPGDSNLVLLQPVIAVSAQAVTARGLLPAQLPVDVGDFVGRGELVAELVECLTPDPAAPVSAVVIGMGGAGKTTLAVHVAHALAEHYPDGQWFADLGGADERPAEPDQVLGVLLRGLGIPEGAVPPDGAARSALLRETVRGRRVLLVLDNARDAAQLATLLPATPGSAVLVTSRNAAAGMLPGAWVTALELLRPEEAKQLFRSIIGARRVDAEPEAVDAIVTACGLLPLAIRIIAARIAARPQWPISAVATRLADERRRLGELRVGNSAVESTFQFGYRQLDPALARAFRLLAVPAVPDLSVAAAAAVLDRTVPEAEQLCEALIDVGLLESPRPGRYRYHDLLRLFAIQVEDPEGERAQALPRLTDHLLATAKNILQRQCPGHRLDLFVETASPGAQFDDLSSMYDWIRAEEPGIIALNRQVAADQPGLAAVCVQIALALASRRDASTHSPQLVRSLYELLDVAVAQGDTTTASRVRVTLAAALTTDLNDPTAAREVLRLALPDLAAAGDRLIWAVGMEMDGLADYFGGRPADAIGKLRTAARTFGSEGDPWNEGRSTAGLAVFCADAGQWDECAAAGERALALAGGTPRPDFESIALKELSRVALVRDGDAPRALALAEKAVRAARGHGRFLYLGFALLRSAESALQADRLDLAESAAAEAVRTLTDHGGPGHRAQALVLQSRVLDTLGRTAEAVAAQQEAVALYEKLGVTAPTVGGRYSG